MASSSLLHVYMVQYCYVTFLREDPSLPDDTICNLREDVVRVWVHSEANMKSNASSAIF